MSASGSPAENEVVRKARRRARFQAVRSALTTIFALMFLAAAGGFAWGMWEEVGTSPQRYRFISTRKDTSVLAEWSARMARLIARLQHDERQGHPEQPAAPRRRETTVASIPSRQERIHTVPVNRQPHTTDSDPVLPCPDLPFDSEHDRPEPTDPEPGRSEPRETDDLPPPLPPTRETRAPQPTTKSPGLDPKVAEALEKAHTPPLPPTRETRAPQPTTKSPGLDPKVAEALEKAHKNFDIAWKYHQKARPDAPASGRNAANKMAIQYLKLAKQQYEAVLQHKIPADIRERVQSRLVDLNSLLYWSMKLSSIK